MGGKKANNWNDPDALAAEIRKTESRGEALLLVALWGERKGWTPRAQYEIGSYRADVEIPEAKVVLESDGFAFHSSNIDMERDHERQNAIQDAGWEVRRYSASKSFLTTGECAKSALKVINDRLKGKAGAVPLPSDAHVKRTSPSHVLTDVEMAKIRDGAELLLNALSKGSPGVTTPVPRRQRR
jgi:very-short-patch-repair endonuclease